MGDYNLVIFSQIIGSFVSDFVSQSDTRWKKPGNGNSMAKTSQASILSSNVLGHYHENQDNKLVNDGYCEFKLSAYNDISSISIVGVSGFSGGVGVGASFGCSSLNT
ncbi:hypothetical protein GIB67_016646 [Kingdonia uniflora]|uniref:Uncharacterized protein n=1 Tax=Kingdonia uniflora TaxID=39325 RepID=A0A7J7MZL3_9MAGN|nr:hypothetical protein GIB67_016646 [Kingdonia uniflora]